MILSERTIRHAVETGRIGIDPTPEPAQYQPASVDVQIGPEIYDVLTDTQRIVDDIVLRPGDRYLAHTIETVDLPNDIAAMLVGRSTLGRAFVQVHQTAGWLDPGFTGQVTLEVGNFSHSVVVLQPGDLVGQVVFLPTDEPTSGYDGQYQDDTGAVPPGEL